MQPASKIRPAILSCRNLGKSFSTHAILRGVTFAVKSGEKIGIVGPNGSGKSTLLKILAQALEADMGTISHQKGTVTTYFPQTHSPAGVSGGELAKRVLQPIMQSGADIFLLDEPTNNLDAEGLELVEQFVLGSEKTFLIVSHDRTFLDRTVTKIIELDPYAVTSAVVYDGNYSAYTKEKAARVARAWATYADSQEEEKRLKNEAEQRLVWMERIEHKRVSTKNLPIHEREKPVAADLRDQEGRAGRRARIIKDRLQRHQEKSVTIEKPVHELPLHIVFEPTRGSTKVFEAQGASAHGGSKIIGPITAAIRYGDRVHITGRNGAGKTTLIKMFLGDINLCAGNVTRGEQVRIGYIPQERHQNTNTQTVLDRFLERTELDQTNARKILHRFRLTTEDIGKPISAMSPGEYSRLILAELVAQRPNCIILDEPSNHLDLEALEELETGLARFTGTLIVASHDRYFIEKIGLTSEIVLR